MSKSKSNSNSYTWVDAPLADKAKNAFQVLTGLMNDYAAGDWRQEWLIKIPYNRKDEIFKEIYDEVCAEYGYTGFDADCGVIARAEAKKRFNGIRQFFEAYTGNTPAFPTLAGFIRYNYHHLTRYIGDVIAVTDGVPALVDGWQSVVDGLCTFTIPEAFQPLCDLLRDNEQVCAGLIGACKSVHIYEPWRGMFDDEGKFSIVKFGRWAKNPQG